MKIIPYKAGRIKNRQKLNKEYEAIIIEREKEGDYDLINECILEEMYINEVIDVLMSDEPVTTKKSKTGEKLREIVRKNLEDRHKSSKYIVKNLKNIDDKLKSRINSLTKAVKQEATDREAFRTERGQECFLIPTTEDKIGITEIQCYTIDDIELDIRKLQQQYGIIDDTFPVEIEDDDAHFLVESDGTIILYPEFSESLKKDRELLFDRVITFANKIYSNISWDN